MAANSPNPRVPNDNQAQHLVLALLYQPSNNTSTTNHICCVQSWNGASVAKSQEVPRPCCWQCFAPAHQVTAPLPLLLCRCAHLLTDASQLLFYHTEALQLCFNTLDLGA